MDLVVRALTPVDWTDCRDLRLRALAGSPSAFGSTLAREESYDEATWRARTSGTVAAYAEGAPVAIGVGLVGSATTYAVTSMWTDPAWRGRGIGGRVLDVVVAAGLERGLVPRLFVMRDNPAVARLAGRHGFTRTGLVEEHGGRPAEEMRRQAEP